MGKIKNLRNYGEILDEFADILKQFDRKCNKYHTDVYLYIDEDTNKGILDLFQNVGGRSWIDDDHICIYTDYPHEENAVDNSFVTIDELADAIGLTEDELIRMTAEYFGYDEDEIDFSLCKRFIFSDSKLSKRLDDVIDEILEDYTYEYYRVAEKSLDDADDSLRECIGKRYRAKTRRKRRFN